MGRTLRRRPWPSYLLLLLAVVLAACGDAARSPASTPPASVTSVPSAPVKTATPLSTAIPTSTTVPPTVPAVATATPAASATSRAPAATATRANTPVALKSQTVEGGGVTVVVTPLALKPRQPFVFDIAMDTHSVDLSGDMLKQVVLRLDAGTEYVPTTWDGAAPGGHHREGKIKFAALPTQPKTVTLVVKTLAGVPERKFTWDVPQ